MYVKPDTPQLPEDITVNEDVAEYIERRGCDFRVCTSCGGPILLPVGMKPAKSTDLKIRSGNHTIYISIHQARYLHSIHRGMLPMFLDQMEDYSTCHEY
ncbi:MAG: hypothetical protein WC502_06365 [Methanolinea sp.]|jgi:hypothetical protein|nr:hypothetical protein [Methanolinea sp.]